MMGVTLGGKATGVISELCLPQDKWMTNKPIKIYAQNP